MIVKKSVFYPFTIIQIPQVEKWLQLQAEKGFKLVEYKRGKFIFEKSEPKEREYFVFVDFLFDKKGKFSSELFLIKKLYSLRKSSLDKSNRTVTEVDLRKKDCDYSCFHLSRTQYYITQYLQYLIFFAIFLFASSIVTFFEILVLPLTLFLASVTLYYAISIFVLKYQMRSYLKNINSWLSKHSEV